MSNTCIRRRVLKLPLACVAVQCIHFEGQVRHEEVRQHIVVEIGAVDAHAGIGLAVFVVSRACCKSGFIESTVAVVAEQEAHDGIIGNIDIHPTVSIVIGERHAEPLPQMLANAGSVGNIGERPVAVFPE